ncbi:MAG: metalloregulator ArsR/SmtB family transcription factor [Pseudomonadota bacterium]|nr:metalloregulator ArsR/SmtB family transcription factor [Pseudomonadota bacterium]
MSILTDDFFAALAHPLRLRMLMLLQQEGELCVCELTHTLEVSQPMVSRHLAQLREAGLVADRRQGLWIYYRLHPELPEWASQVLSETARGVGQQAPFAEDRKLLQHMPNRPDGRCCA